MVAPSNSQAMPGRAGNSAPAVAPAPRPGRGGVALGELILPLPRAASAVESLVADGVSGDARCRVGGGLPVPILAAAVVGRGDVRASPAVTPTLVGPLDDDPRHPASISRPSCTTARRCASQEIGGQGTGGKGSQELTGQSLVEINRLAVVMLSNSTQKLALQTRWHAESSVSKTKRQTQAGRLTRLHV